MSNEAGHQLDLPIGGSSSPSLVRITRKENRERAFVPVAGVPKTRGECPTERPCVHVRCRYNLFRIDGHDRAGRPGLSHVPRDEHGHTLATPGAIGQQRAGTTLVPAWLEIERTCLVRIGRDERGSIDEVVPLHRTRGDSDSMWNWGGKPIGTWDLMRPTLKPGASLYVFDYVNQYDALDCIGIARLGEDESLRFDADVSPVVVLLANPARRVSSCALDLVDVHGRMTNEQIGEAMGRHRTLVAREVKRAAGKVKAMGVDLRDVME